MRKHIPWVIGVTLLGLVGLTGRSEDYHSHRPKAKPSEGRLEIYPRPIQLPTEPPTVPYRSSYFFPVAPPVKPARDEVYEVGLTDNYISPTYATIPAGKTVRFTNRGKHIHTTTCNWLWESGDMQPGATFCITFSLPGRYYYRCRHHGDMWATLVVY